MFTLTAQMACEKTMDSFTGPVFMESDVKKIESAILESCDKSKRVAIVKVDHPEFLDGFIVILRGKGFRVSKLQDPLDHIKIRW